MSITQYEAILHSILRSEADWNADNTVIPLNQIVYAEQPNSTPTTRYIYIKIGNGRDKFADLPKASLSEQDINNLISINDVKVNGISVVDNKVAIITVPETASDLAYENTEFPDIENVGEALDVILNNGIFPSQTNNENKFLATNGTNPEWRKAVTQLDTLPDEHGITPDMDKMIVQYVGQTTDQYVKGYFYKAVIGSMYQEVITNVLSNIPAGNPDPVIVDIETLDNQWNQFAEYDGDHYVPNFQYFKFLCLDNQGQHQIVCRPYKNDGTADTDVVIGSVQNLENYWGIQVFNPNFNVEGSCLTFSVVKDSSLSLSHWERIDVQPGGVITNIDCGYLQ